MKKTAPAKNAAAGFLDPGAGFRSSPFWAWNDSLNERELARQLDEMKKGGMAGGFMHSREGLITPYLGKRWMSCVSRAVSRAKELGIPAYLYDEDRWPSGFASGRLTKKPGNAMKALRISGGRKEIITLPPLEWFNDSPYLDTLDGAAVRKFIEAAYLPYGKMFGKEFGKTLPAIFTDEPNTLFTGKKTPKKGFYFPWTGGLEKTFRSRYGYSMLENAGMLAENRGDCRRVRYHYWKTVGELFRRNFAEQIYDWCGKSGIALTGHYNAEDTISSQIDQMGAAMPLYEFMHIPGVDHLGRQLANSFLTIKQCASAAHQFGKERVLSELFGCSGQNMTFEDRKRIADWNIVLGVNFLCPHLWLYSMAGSRKRDYPPTISFQQPYWKHNKILEDYFARLCFIMSRGRFSAKILLIHPVESGWCLFTPADTGPVEALNDSLLSIMRSLSSNRFGYDLGDESIIAGRGAALLKDRKPVFKVGQMGYELVIIPPAVTLRSSTLRLLADFSAMGGRVIGFSPAPELVDGEPSRGRAGSLYSGIPLFGEAGGRFIREVGSAVPADVSVKSGESGAGIRDIYCHKRSFGGRVFYFLSNTSWESSFDAELEVPAGPHGRLEYWDGQTGSVSPLPSRRMGKGGLAASLHFPAGGSHLIAETSLSAKPVSVPRLPPPSPAALRRLPGLGHSGWRITPLGHNCLTLDFCRVKRPSSKRWSRSRYVLDVQQELEKKLKRGDGFAVKYSFASDIGSPGEIFLAVERPGLCGIRVNGKPVKKTRPLAWLDSSFARFDITGCFRPAGENTVVLERKFMRPRKKGTRVYEENGTEVEAVYITGDFNVSGEFREDREGYFGSNFILRDPRPPSAGEVVTSGYPFYAGNFILSREFDFSPGGGKRYFLVTAARGPAAVLVSVNGTAAHSAPGIPGIFEITRCLKPGRNAIEIELAGSLRNLLGPHHTTAINPVFVGPGSFNDRAGWTDEYGFSPFGMKSAWLAESEK